MKVLITGSKGALGQDVAEVFRAQGHEVVALDREGLDITDREAVMKLVSELKPDVIINCAAYNLVDKVESDDVYATAYAINALGPGYLAEAARDHEAVFVHLSTDYVFPGENPEGYVEHDERRPISKYGQTKVSGEELVEQAGGKFYIVRTSKLFGRPGSSAEAKESFVNLMLRLAASKPELSIVDEEVGCPTYTLDLSSGIYELVSGDFEPGIYHLVNSGPGVTWYQFAEEFFNLKNVTTPRKPVSSKDFPKPAARPRFAALLNSKFPPLRSRLEALKDFLQS
ncbi:MAG: dTDP-4-dehydrorhamnose reductase [Patescibacteria group bacterium]